TGLTSSIVVMAVLSGGPKPCHRRRNPLSRSSEELFDHVNRSVDANLADANCKQSVQEGILRFGCLEARHRTKVGGGWRFVVTNALEGHVDEGAVVGL